MFFIKFIRSIDEVIHIDLDHVVETLLSRSVCFGEVGILRACSRVWQELMAWHCPHFPFHVLLGHVSCSLRRCAKIRWRFDPSHMQGRGHDQSSRFPLQLWQDIGEVPFLAVSAIQTPKSVLDVPFCHETPSRCPRRLPLPLHK